MKARRSKFGTSGRGDKSSSGGSSRTGGGRDSRASGGPGSSEGGNARSGGSRSGGARGPHPSRTSSGPRVARGPGARASGKGKTRGDSGGAPSRGSRSSSSKGSDGAHVGSVVEGVVSANRAGYGFLRVDGMKDSVFIPPKEMNGVMHGDRLKVKLAQDSSDRWLGTVEGVVSRGVKQFLGTVDVQGRTAWVNAADRRLQLHCAVSYGDLNGAKSRDWVIARITKHANSIAPAQAVVVKRLDPDRPVELATESAIARFDLPHEFSSAALREAQGWGDRVDPAESDKREDLRSIPLVTIDGETARDFDDAVYAEPHEDGFRLIVAIADVSHYVRPDSALDTEARERGTSVYFPTRVIPMLPHALSDNLCSLAPHVDRLCFAADMLISKNGALRGTRFFPAVMRSAARLTYKQAFEALFEGRPAAREELGPLVERLLPLVDVYRALLKARGRRGALDFDAAEAEFVIDSSERVKAIEMRVRNDAHRMIEECMIMANVATAQELSKKRTPTLYRVHGQPEGIKLERLQTTLHALGIDVQIPETVTTRDLQAITKRLGTSEARPFIESLVVRAMPQAVYQPTNIGHFGLALTHYAHFTSPIRRYPDLVVHRTLKALIGAQGGSAVQYGTDELEAMGEANSKLEKRSDEADRYVATFLKCTYLRERIGQTFHGIITTVVEFGCFVQILDVGVDGLLHLDNLRDDEYVMEDDGHAWTGKRSGRRLRTGAHIRVIVTSVNPIEGLIDLDLVEDVAG
ncbi:MAG: ribonuclease [Gammaproteobacteria bacterium]|nr:ribonuclease [Gammaproteobacteria bacterium]